MYFITGIEDLDPEWGTKGTHRCFGYKETFDKADQAVKENRCDINETIYNYVVIEFIKSGIHSICLENRWFYKFDYDKGIYEPIEEPGEVKGFCNFAIG